MRPDFVVIASPEFDLLPGVVEIQEPVLIQAFIAETPIEALDVSVLDWLTGRMKKLYAMKGW